MRADPSEPMEPVEPVDVDALVADLRARVEKRREAGMYPLGLEEDLDMHFRRILTHRVTPKLDQLRMSVDALGEKHFSLDRIPASSRVPGGSALHSAVGKVTSRQGQGILRQVQELADSVRDALEQVVAALEGPASHGHPELTSQLDAVMEQLATYQRGPSTSEAAIGELRRRVEQLEESEQRRTFRPWFRNDRFEDQFRGSHEQLVDRYRDLAQQFQGLGPVLDIGCGRGEFLELLVELGVEASGVEIDPQLAEAASNAGLDVKDGDGLRVLAAAADQSLGGISLIQVIEHLTAQQVVDVVSLAGDKLRPGGKIVVETVNPQSLYVFAHSFYLDPTHTQPLHPAYLTFLFQEAGFPAVAVDWRSPPPPDEVLDEVELDGPGGERVNANWHRLNRLLFGPQDYAVIATR